MKAVTKRERWFFMVVILIGLVLIGVLGYCVKKYTVKSNGGASQPSQEQVTQEIDKLVDSSHMLGTLVMIKNGETVYEKSYGDADHERQLPNSAETLYPIASLQKGLTSVVIAQLIREGKLTYETTIDRFYPDLAHSKEITIRDLLDFTSGYVMPEVASAKVLKTEAAQLENAIKTSEYLGRGTYRYSNGSFSLLAGIISFLDKRTYQESLQTRILDPLEMRHTYFWNELPKDGQIPKEYLYLAGKNYQVAKNVYSEALMSTLLGAGNLYATAADIGKFEVSMNSKLLVSDEEYQTLFEISPNEILSRMGNISSDGQLGGYSSYIYSNRSQKNGIILLLNQTSLEFNPRLLEKLYRQLATLN